MLTLDRTRTQVGSFTLSVDLSLAEGERLGVMGASGSGKSTLLSLIAGFLRPDSGRVMIAGEDVTDRAVADRPLSILFQDGNLFPHLSVFDNVALAISPRLSLTAEERAQVDDHLSQVGLEGMGGRRPADLSGGQQSRVALARMLLRARPLALFDEPFAALDPGLRREMVNLVDDLVQHTGQTTVMVSHDFSDVAQLCDRVVLLEAGEVALDLSVAEALETSPKALKPWL